MRAVLAAVLAAAWPVSTRAICPFGWTLVGPPQYFSNVSGADFDFSGAAPTVAVGFLDADTGATKIYIQQLDGAGTNWTTLVSHEPQFAQDYDHFIFRVRSGLAYVGIGIEGEGIASVLRGGSGYNNMDGSWAFPASGASWGFDIDALGGDMRLFGWANATSVGLVDFNHSGWDSYPATDAFGPVTPVFLTSSAPPSAIVSVVAGQYPALAGAALLGAGDVSIVMFSVQNTTALTQLPELASGASTVALAWGGPWLCAAFDQPAGGSGPGSAVVVFCMANPGPTGVWVSAGAPGSGAVLQVAAHVASLSLSLAPDGSAVVAVLADDGTAVVASCSLNIATGGCAGGLWKEASAGPRGDVSGLVVHAAPTGASVLGSTVALVTTTVSMSGGVTQQLDLCSAP
jgi:hypothetical protein